MRAQRRALLGTITSVALGGCLTDGGRSTLTPPPDHDSDGAPDPHDDYPDDERRAVRTSRIAGSPTLKPGEYTALALTNSPDARGDVLHYEVSVAGETSVDCVVFERDAYDAYADGDRDVPVVSEYSRTDVTDASVTVELDRGEYIYAVDYTSLLTEPGPASVTVDHVVEVAEPAPTQGSGR